MNKVNEVKESVRSWVEQNENRIIKLVQDLVSHNTVNHVLTGTEKEAQILSFASARGYGARGRYVYTGRSYWG